MDLLIMSRETYTAYNTSRVVYSMVIEGLRYGSKPLLEMKIHDIALLTDLSRPDPLNPAYPPPTGDPENGMVYDKAFRRGLGLAACIRRVGL